VSEFQVIESTVAQTARRRRWQRAWCGLWQGVLLGSLLLLTTLVLYKVLPVPMTVLAVGGGLFVVAMGAGFFLGGWRREAPLTTARWLDQREHLQERLSTALEMSRDPRAGHWRELVLADAASHLGKLDFRRLLPWQLPRTSRWALLALTLAAGLGFVPEYRSKEFHQRQREQESVREAGRNLADLTRRSLEHRQPVLENTRAAMKSVSELGDQLAHNPVTRPEAMRDLAKVTDKVQEQARELERNPALRPMERAASSSGRNQMANADELKKQIESLQKNLGSKEANAEALDKLKQELQKAQQAAANMMAKGSQASDAAKASLAKALASLSRQAQDLGATLPSLEEAISALEASKIDQVMKDLEVAEKDLEKMEQMAQSLQQLQQQAAQMGKDLAEQLDKGQADAAAATLRKLSEQLKAGKLAPEQLKAIADEVAKAIKPAGPYGKVPDLLKQAARQMQQDQRPGASQSLAAAAKELDDLMQQMADAQDLKDTLDALKRAQLCVGTCQSWGQCKSDKIGYKPGGKPGRGVGDWAGDTPPSEAPENTGLWDNSGVERPDKDPRGQTDRGAGDLPPGLTPTKVKGRFTPGSQMPSITLKGVSIKGQSTVAFQQAVTAAQSEAQAALSQEQVPRAYQGAVKDYFDDLKK
jgi:hypothetical protein